MMNATMMTKQKEINLYIEECAKWKKELDNEAAENERIRRLLQSYKGCDYIIDRIYPTIEGFEAFKDEETKPKKKKDTGKKQGVQARKRKQKAHSGNKQIKNFLPRRKRMKLT
ncbi:hypothetical protein HanXRQr2_Chr06g0264531 [Helianthus annuus]|uniref:Uncharacterized protein n=1 Tax=Helianthus annuus TaxID=4232 RepID=A0A9K3IU14_HELAN|nr:hypothetical protein HanXRQr2_Chr06g0264531 [Helianthus annuus]